MRQLYDDGMRELLEPGPEKGGSAFCGIHDELVISDLTEERLADGDWAYRCDELTRLWALGNYRCALTKLNYRREQPGAVRTAHGHFCWALRVRPEVVFDVAKHDGLSPEARKIFDAETARCFVEGGMRFDYPPHR